MSDPWHEQIKRTGCKYPTSSVPFPCPILRYWFQDVTQRLVSGWTGVILRTTFFVRSAQRRKRRPRLGDGQWVGPSRWKESQMWTPRALCLSLSIIRWKCYHTRLESKFLFIIARADTLCSSLSSISTTNFQSMVVLIPYLSAHARKTVWGHWSNFFGRVHHYLTQ